MEKAHTVERRVSLNHFVIVHSLTGAVERGELGHGRPHGAVDIDSTLWGYFPVECDLRPSP